ncbi:MAG: oligosaccharide flippase family protein [Chitinispirillaceae bacterium]|nr:oligosaccharide flippase family protein [Chitinispirillaceae bacterium]
MMKQFIAEHLGSKKSLRRKTIFGMGWMVVRQFGLAAIETVKTMVFARVLDAYAYGVMALATMAVGFLESFTALGLDLVILRDGDDYRKNLNSYWTIKALRGITLFCVGWMMAPLFASLYGNHELTLIIRFMCTAFLFDGFSGFGREVNLRNMAFARGAGYEVGVIAVATAVSIAVLFHVRSVWALAFYAVFASLSRFVASYCMMPWMPRLQFNRDVGKVVLTFGVSIIGMNALNYLFNNFDKAIIGKMLDLEQLGYYARANFLALLPSSYIASAISPVFLPSLRPIANDTVRLRNAFFKATAVYALLFGLLGIALFVFARPFVLLLYGKNWLAVIPLFQIMIIFGIFKSMCAVCPTILFLKGKPWLNTICSGLMVVVFCGLSIPMINAFQLAGIAWALVIAGLLSNTLSMAFTVRLLWFSSSEASERVTLTVGGVSSDDAITRQPE